MGMGVSTTELRESIKRAGSIRGAERALRKAGVQISERTIRRRLKDYEVSNVPELDVSELIERRSQRYEVVKKQTEAAAHRRVYLRSNKPIGIGFQGDGHLDDDGTDVGLFFEHAELFNGTNDGLYLGFMGDIWNNWIGRLTKLWGNQTSNFEEALALVEHYCTNTDFLFFLLGNHDLWGGKEDILQYMIRAASTCDIVAKHQQKVTLVFPNKKEVTIYARHKFPGNSMWMTQFGQLKTAQLDGTADIYVGGDKHVSGYSNGVHPGTQRMFHAIQVASYKRIDEYPIELGLLPRDLYNCPVAIIDPAKDDLNMIRWEFDPFEAVERVQWERSRR